MKLLIKIFPGIVIRNLRTVNVLVKIQYPEGCKLLKGTFFSSRT